MDGAQAVIEKALQLLFGAGAPLWVILAIVFASAVLLVLGPKIRIPAIKLPPPEPAPVVDEGGEQQPGTALPPAPPEPNPVVDEGGPQPPGSTLPTDPNREDLDYGGSG